MSGQGNPSRLPKLSPNSAKQGPIKATIPMSSLVNECSSIKSDKSPPVSPTYYLKTGRSPDHYAGQRSPGSSAYKGKRRIYSSPGMRRTASLDTLYLQGQWPMHPSLFSMNRATQTEASESSDGQNIGYTSDVEDKMDKCTIRQKLRTTKDSKGRRGSAGESTLTSSVAHVSSMKSNMGKRVSRTSIRSSEEGLNQEIEQIVLRNNIECFSALDDRFSLETPDGHRAPLADILSGTRSRSVDTQTPQDFSSSHSSSGSSPEQGNKLSTSPHINKFVARAPPDGCEKVFLKTMDKGTIIGRVPPQPPCTFKLKPSLGSAFQILQPDSNEDPGDLDHPPPSEEQD